MTEGQDSHKIELIWEGVLEPTGTLFRDDLEELETLLRSEDHHIELVWTLEGNTHRGSAKITAPTINEVIEHRRELEVPDTLELQSVHWYDPSSDYEGYYSQFDSVFESRLVFERSGWLSDEMQWAARITTHDTLRQGYERCRFGIREIFDRASQTSWARTHKKVRAAASNMWLLLIPLTYLVLQPAALVLLHRWWDVPSEWWQFLYLFGALYVPTGILLSPLKERVDANASWQAPPFDLTKTRSLEALASPPEIIRRDVAISLVVAIAGTIATIIIATVMR